MVVLDICHAKKNFGSKQVLQDVTFQVPENCIFGFVGRNGAGKTTLMKAVLGFMPLNSGKIKLCGKEITYGKKVRADDIGYLPDVPEFYGYMNAREYLSLCGELVGMSKKDINVRSDELLELVGLATEKSRIGGFSRGMKQRLGVAQALYHRPKLVIFDEPTSALDPLGRKEILDILVEVGKYASVIFSTHILTDVEKVCNKVAFLENGKIVLSGSVNELKDIDHRSQIDITFKDKKDISIVLAAFSYAERSEKGIVINNASDNEADEVMQFIMDNRLLITGYHKDEPTLESLFMEVVR